RIDSTRPVRSPSPHSASRSSPPLAGDRNPTKRRRHSSPSLQARAGAGDRRDRTTRIDSIAQARSRGLSATTNAQRLLRVEARVREDEAEQKRAAEEQAEEVLRADLHFERRVVVLHCSVEAAGDAEEHEEELLVRERQEEDAERHPDQRDHEAVGERADRW